VTFVKYVLNFIRHPAVRLPPYAEDIIGGHQCGFRRNRSTTDRIFYIRQIVEKKNGNTMK
jgi:hypothetical protein